MRNDTLSGLTDRLGEAANEPCGRRGPSLPRDARKTVCWRSVCVSVVPLVREHVWGAPLACEPGCVSFSDECRFFLALDDELVLLTGFQRKTMMWTTMATPWGRTTEAPTVPSTPSGGRSSTRRWERLWPQGSLLASANGGHVDDNARKELLSDCFWRIGGSNMSRKTCTELQV